MRLARPAATIQFAGHQTKRVALSDRGKDEMRRILAIMINVLLSLFDFSVQPRKVSCVQITVPERKTAAGNVQTQPMTFLEYVAGCLKINPILIDHTRGDKVRFLPVSLFTKTSTDHTFCDVDGTAIRIHVYEAAYEVSVWSG